jgi:hypothetical protein
MSKPGGDQSVEPSDIRVRGAAIAYRVFDVGYSVALDDAARLLGESTVRRTRPGRTEARAIEIRNPPIVAALGSRQLAVEGQSYTALVSARLFDFGVCALHLRIPIPSEVSWAEFTSFGSAVNASTEVQAVLEREFQALIERVTPAIERPGVAPIVEEFVVFRIDWMNADDRGRTTSQRLTDERLVPLLLGEGQPLSADARHELMPHRFSYHDDDLTVLTWENALVVEPSADDFDVEYVLEFANAQLLELRLYDLQLDADLPKLYDRVAAARARQRWRSSGRFRAVLADLQTRVGDITETVERVENAIKLTNDVYLARIYVAALQLFREQAWRRGIERKLGILRDTYAMLNSEAQVARAELLEIAIVVLIVAELVLGILRSG